MKVLLLTLILASAALASESSKYVIFSKFKNMSKQEKQDRKKAKSLLYSNGLFERTHRAHVFKEQRTSIATLIKITREIKKIK